MIFYLGLGANLGEREENILSALEEIKKIPGTKLLRVSSFYETAAWGVTNQPDFINAAAKISSTLKPEKLLDELQQVEKKFGRVRREHWGARTLDIDILLSDEFVLKSERLTIPHPYLYERDFVLIPLSEILPGLKFQPHGDDVKKVSGSPADFKFKFVACVDKNFGLGNAGELLFKIPEDLKNFRALTLNNTIIFGRKTFETFPGGVPLDSRRNILLSRTVKKIPGAEVVPNVPELFKILKPDEKNFVIGGGEIFSELMPYADEIFLTVVDAEVEADTFFPEFADEFFLTDEKIFSGDLNCAFKNFRRQN